MKNIYILLLSVLNATIIVAQPTITSNWAPSGNFGSNITVTSNNGAHVAGASGANCTWNLTTWPAAASFNSLDTCSFTVSTTDYPGTTDLITETPVAGTYYRFRKLAGSVFQNLGYDVHYFPTNDYDHYVWSTPIDLLHFPVNYNNQFITNGFYSRQWSSGSSNYSSHGGAMILVSVDGYGTLNTPMGSFVNVLRIHTQENYTDSVDVSFQNWNITSSGTERYDWISANRPGIILANTSTTTNINGTTYYSYYSHVAPTSNTGIDELTDAMVKLELYPQPVTAQTKAYISMRKSCQATVTITSMEGGKLFHQDILLRAGNNEIPVDAGNFHDGMYLLTIRSEETVRTQRLIVLNP